MPSIKSSFTLNTAQTNKYIDHIIQSIESGNSDSAMSLLDEFLEMLKSSKQPIENIKNLCLQLCSLCSRLLGNYNVFLQDVIENGDNIYKEILQSKSISHLSLILHDIIKAISVFLGSDEYQGSNIIHNAMEYIKSSYNMDIGLQSVAKHIHVSSSYLSRIFSKKTGETIIEYITKIRMEKAKELLKSANIQIFEVAALVGIEDPAYFSHLFKKHTGLSPKEFKYNCK